MRVLGVIPARGASKGIPRKNIRPLMGKPLLQYTADTARDATGLERTLLSTDDTEIAEIGERLGLWIPFLRPAELARDDTPTIKVLLHLVDWLEAQDERYDAFCLLQPTCPLRTSQEIDAAVDLLDHSGADSVISVAPVAAHFHPEWQMTQDEAGELRLWNGGTLSTIVTRRQMLPPTYIRTGSIYAMRHKTLAIHHSLYGARCAALLTPAERHVNLDTLADWEIAERLLTQT